MKSIGMGLVRLRLVTTDESSWGHNNCRGALRRQAQASRRGRV
jgi:hypothetical protein